MTVVVSSGVYVHTFSISEQFQQLFNYIQNNKKENLIIQTLAFNALFKEFCNSSSFLIFELLILFINLYTTEPYN